VLVTAGPTYEPIDPVRFLGNRSSGKMGYAVAEMAIRRGARVVLISGPTALKPPAVAEFVSVETAEQMRQAVMERFPDATIVIKTAAVSDFRPTKAAGQKIKREKGISLELEPTGDILAELGATKFPKHIIIGFAAETENLIENARKKLTKKNVDAIVLNDVSRTDIGFGSEKNAITIVTPTEQIDVPMCTKQECAGRVLDLAVKLRETKSSQAEKRTVPAKL
jgi:phosphopantothenoylcysteine decarboxylase / phosphopantothenate---cysteine ligase